MVTKKVAGEASLLEVLTTNEEVKKAMQGESISVDLSTKNCCRKGKSKQWGTKNVATKATIKQKGTKM
jgi:hypothetical protein